MKTCPICKTTFPTKNALAQHMQAKHSTQRKAQPKSQQRARPQGNMSQRVAMTQLPYNDATCHVARTEWIAEVKSSNDSSSSVAVSLEVSSDALPVLSKLAQLFDRYIVNSISLLYKGAVATTRDGVVYFGIDYDGRASKETLSIQKVLKFPNKSCAVWSSDCALPLKYDKQVRYVKGTDLRDKLGKVIAYATTDKPNIVLGNLFVKYDLTLTSLTGD